jgi:hypothetical protein
MNSKFKKTLAGIVIAGSIAAGALIPGCNKSSNPSYDIHEWGVMEGCLTDSTVLVTSRPELDMMVKQPVIYIHSNEQFSLSLEAKVIGMTNEESVLTYPEADVKGNSISWENVEVTSEKISLAVPKIRVPNMMIRKGIEEIIPMLNDVDSNTLKYNGIESKFLFYEAEMKFENPIELSFDIGSVTVKNTGDYPVDSMFFVTGVPGASPFMQKLMGAKIGNLAPGEEKTAQITAFNEEYNNTLKADVMAKGFTEKETDAFTKLWAGQFFSSSSMRANSQLIYAIPEEQYNRILQLKTSKKFSDIERLMYVRLDATSKFSEKYGTIGKDEVKIYRHILPEEARKLLQSENWNLEADPEYNPDAAHCEACGWICSYSATPLQWSISEGANELEIKIKNVPCIGILPEFNYNGTIYQPSGASPFQPDASGGN